MSTVHHVHFCIRPDSDGAWYVQNDADHTPIGVDLSLGVVHEKDHLRVYFSPTFDSAGAVQVSTDDDFAGSLVASAGLGTQCVAIKIRAHPHVRGVDPAIDPRRIWEYLRDHPKTGGNLWVIASMVNA